MKKDKKQGQAYPSDRTDKQWAEIEPLYSGLRKYKWSKRAKMQGVKQNRVMELSILKV